MTTLSSLAQVFVGGLLLFTVTLMGKPRLPALVRNYAFASLCLAGLTVATSLLRGDAHPFLAAAGTVVFKVVLIPWILLLAARRYRASNQLKFIMRPGATYLVVACMLVVSYLVTRDLPHGPGIALVADGHGPGIEALYVSVLLVLLGLAFMIMRRDIYSQIVGFMVMENGVVAYGVLAIGGLPLLVEIGILLTVTAGTMIMAVLSRQVQETYATGDTHSLTELTD